MTNIKNFNFNKLDLKLSNSDYWDFFLANDDRGILNTSGVTSGDCFVVWYDFNNPAIYSGTTNIYSLVSWDGGVNTGYTFDTIGLTGIDNGLVPFVKDPLDPANSALVMALTGSTLVIPSGDTRLMMTQVSGSTGHYVYPVTKVIDPTFTLGDYQQFCGGFYQGYYKIDGSSYEVLPTRVSQAWAAEFWLNSQDNCSGFTGTTLNDTYPNNKGLFFYMGTRAENKFWSQFAGADIDCWSACTATTACTGTVSTFCTVLKERDLTIIGDYGFGIPLNPPQIKIELITNPFLIYGRAYDDRAPKITGQTDTIIPSAITNTSNQLIVVSDDIGFFGDMVDSGSACNILSTDGLGTQQMCTYDGKGIAVASSAEVITDFTNPFLIYGRGRGYFSGCTCDVCCGPNDGYGSNTLYSYSGKTSLQSYVDYRLDVTDNALGFRIKDDGSIGYRYLTLSGACSTLDTGERIYTSGLTIQEGYSVPNVIVPNKWNNVVIRFTTDYLDDCQLKTHKARVGRLMFYVNGRLKYVVDEFPEFVGKRLEEYRAKQVAVPFNMSLGGGSQGLIESQTFDGPDPDDMGLPIETNFAGSFIGGISQFKFNICDLTFSDIQHNFNTQRIRYGIQDTDLILTEDDLLLLQQNGYGLLWD